MPREEKALGAILIFTFIEVGVAALAAIASWEGLHKLEEWVRRSWNEEKWLEEKLAAAQADAEDYGAALEQLRATRDAAEARRAEVEGELVGDGRVEWL